MVSPGVARRPRGFVRCARPAVAEMEERLYRGARVVHDHGTPCRRWPFQRHDARRMATNPREHRDDAWFDAAGSRPSCPANVRAREASFLAAWPLRCRSRWRRRTGPRSCSPPGRSSLIAHDVVMAVGGGCRSGRLSAAGSCWPARNRAAPCGTRKIAFTNVGRARTRPIAPH